MSRIAAIAAAFIKEGGVFVTEPERIAGALKNVRALAFDWDGVLGSGRKGSGEASSFHEADSMGTNMLRYGLWRVSKRLPAAAIITGENSPAAYQFAKRERFVAVYRGVRDKRTALEHLCRTRGIEPGQVAFFFDDVNDLGLARECGARFMLRRKAGPMFRDYAMERKLCDYIAANDATNAGVREICELMLALLGEFENVLDSRIAVDESYREYFQARQTSATEFFTEREGEIVAVEDE